MVISNKIWFHGCNSSRTFKNKALYKPSLYKIFYIAENLDYAINYMDVDGGLFAISLKSSAKICDLQTNEIDQFQWPIAIKKFFKKRKSSSDIYLLSLAILYDLPDDFLSVKDSTLETLDIKSLSDYSEWLEVKNWTKTRIEKLNINLAKLNKSSFTTDLIYVLIRDLASKKYQGFKTTEYFSGITSNVIGIFNYKALDNLIIRKLDFEKTYDLIKKLNSHDIQLEDFLKCIK